MPSYYVWNIGCQMNAADARRATEGLEALGLEAAPDIEQADVIVLNTCVVRQSAETRVWGRLSSLKPVKRHRPGAFLALMGCAVGDDTDALAARFPFVDAFIRPSDVNGLLDAIRRHGLAGGMAAGAATPAPVSRSVTAIHGCDHHCTYCIVRLRRGAQVSRPLHEILAEVRGATAQGSREIVLLGQNVDAYGRDLPEPLDLADLLRAVHGVEDVWRIRFLTSHPADLSPRVIEAARDLPKVCEHFELPVQAGDDAVLKWMGRNYTAGQYRTLVQRIRETVPGAAIATDVIVGFPGETEEAFANTLRLLEEIRFDAVHVAAYSIRPGTPAERLADDVPAPEKERRRRAVDELQQRIVGEINRQLLGHTVEVLVEERQRGRWRGRTRTNKLVFFESVEDWTGRLAQVRVTWAGPWSLLGEVASL